MATKLNEPPLLELGRPFGQDLDLEVDVPWYILGRKDFVTTGGDPTLYRDVLETFCSTSWQSVTGVFLNVGERMQCKVEASLDCEDDSVPRLKVRNVRSPFHKGVSTYHLAFETQEWDAKRGYYRAIQKDGFPSYSLVRTLPEVFEEVTGWRLDVGEEVLMHFNIVQASDIWSE